MAALHTVATSCDPPVAGVTRVHVRDGIGKRERIVYNFIRRTQCRPAGKECDEREESDLFCRLRGCVRRVRGRGGEAHARRTRRLRRHGARPLADRLRGRLARHRLVACGTAQQIPQCEIRHCRLDPEGLPRCAAWTRHHAPRRRAGRTCGLPRGVHFGRRPEARGRPPQHEPPRLPLRWPRLDGRCEEGRVPAVLHARQDQPLLRQGAPRVARAARRRLARLRVRRAHDRASAGQPPLGRQLHPAHRQRTRPVREGRHTRPLRNRRRVRTPARRLRGAHAHPPRRRLGAARLQEGHPRRLRARLLRHGPPGRPRRQARLAEERGRSLRVREAARRVPALLRRQLLLHRQLSHARAGRPG